MQQRACDTHLLQVVLPIVDRDIFSFELITTIKALDDCKHESMLHVRTVVSEAFKTAIHLLVEDKFRRNGDDVSPVVMSKSRQGRSYNAIEESLLATSREQEVDLLTHDKELFSNGGIPVNIEAESDTSSSRDNIHSVSSRISTQIEQSTISQVKTGRESFASYLNHDLLVAAVYCSNQQ